MTYERWGVAPSLAFGLGTPTRVTLNYFKLEQNNLSDYGIPWVPATNNVLVDYRDKPAPVPRETFYGFRSRDKEKMGSDLGTMKVEHDFSDNLSLRNQLRYRLLHERFHRHTASIRRATTPQRSTAR